MSLAAAADAWCLVGIVVLTVLASEAASFAVLYRRPDYKRVCERVKVLTKKCLSCAETPSRTSAHRRYESCRLTVAAACLFPRPGRPAS